MLQRPFGWIVPLPVSAPRHFMKVHNIEILHSTVNIVGRNQTTTGCYDHNPALNTSASSLLPINDAPIDLLSVHFTGRENQINLISNAFINPLGDDHNKNNTPRRCALYGTQGVGKSQLTYRWAKWTFDRGQNSYVFWISATTVAKLDRGFSKFLHLVQHPDRSHQDQNVRLTAARRWLEDVDSGNWLVVLDNVFPETLGFLREHLPRKNGRGSVLFTTRTRDVAVALASTGGERHCVVEVPILDVEEAVTLFRGHFDRGEMNAPVVEIEEMMKALGCLPLAISHAAAYMKASGSSVRDMLQVYRSPRKIELISWENALSDYEHRSVAATFNCQLDVLRRECPDASNLLRVLAYLDVENIPMDMLVDGATAALGSRLQTRSGPVRNGHAAVKGDANRNTIMTSLLPLMQTHVDLRTIIMQLHSRSLISVQLHAVRIHDLIQLLVLENAKGDREWFRCAVEIVCSAFGRIQDHQSPDCWPQCEALVPHIQSLRSHQGEWADIQLDDATCCLGRYLNSRGRHWEAARLYEEVLADMQRVAGSEDETTMLTGVMHDLGWSYMRCGRYDDAVGLLTRVLHARERLLGSEHMDTLLTMSCLAMVRIEQGGYCEAEALLERVLSHQERRLGMRDHHTLYTLSGLGRIYRSQGRLSEAEATLRRAQGGYEDMFGAEHPTTLVATHLLAMTLQSQARNEDAEVLFKRVVLARQHLLGPDHPQTLSVMGSLAVIHVSQGRYDEAEKLIAKAVLGFEQRVGLEHPSTLLAKYYLADTYRAQARYDEAEAVVVAVVRAQERLLGPVHHHTKQSHQLLASLLGTAL